MRIFYYDYYVLYFSKILLKGSVYAHVFLYAFSLLKYFPSVENAEC
jgi:hypothetical protein